MPYIIQEKRHALNPHIEALYHELVGLEADDDNNNFEGNMNYTITRLLRMVYGDSYTEINSAIGMLECCKLEHYRKQAAPYENQKLFENGDVKAHDFDKTLNEVVVEEEK